MTLFVSLSTNVARASDEIVQLWKCHPSDVSNVSLYDFIVPTNRVLLANILRKIIDDAALASHSTAAFATNLPPPISSNSPSFFRESPLLLSTKLRGSTEVLQKLYVNVPGEGPQLFEFHIYLGGGLGALLQRRETHNWLYYVMLISKPLPSSASAQPATSTCTQNSEPTKDVVGVNTLDSAIAPSKQSVSLKSLAPVTPAMRSTSVD